MEIALRNKLGLRGLSSDQSKRLKEMLTFEYKERVGKNREVTRQYRPYKVQGNTIFVPSGTRSFLRRVGIPKDALIRDMTVAPPLENELQSIVELRPEQRAIEGIAAKYDHGIIQAPPGFGKTSIAIKEIFCHYQTRTLIIVKTDDLRRQWLDRLEQQSSLSSAEIGTIGKGKWEPRDVTVALWQTLSRRLPKMEKDNSQEYREFLESYGLVFVDETHCAPANKISDVIERFPARYKWGCTATPYRSDPLSLMILYLIGPVRYAAQRPNDSVPVYYNQIRIPDTDYPWADDWDMYRAAMSGDIERADWIVEDIAERAPTPCLVIFTEIAGLTQMYERMCELKPDANVALFTGELKFDEREAIREAGQRGEIDYCFASTIANEGLDWPPLVSVCLTYPGSFSGSVVQKTGRITRKVEGKDSAYVFDYYDGHGIALAQRKRRYMTYKSQGFLHHNQQNITTN